MGIDGISIWQLLIILLLVVVLFGTGKLRRVGTDMGHAIRGFKRGLRGDAEESSADTPESSSDTKTETKARGGKAASTKRH
ncbi:MAG TPA: twin-arginine translocase TatA/TatE family subunit [Gammaproteobacteria bacterium]|nr:twin-arginine translocase TatA/TatE family subunit [Gammaproteobacteria bacterium]